MAVTGDPGPAGRRGLRLAVVDWAPTFYRWRFYRYLKERAGWEPSVLFCGRRHSTFGWEYLPDDALPHRFLPGGRWQFDRAGLRSFYWNRGGPAALAAWRPDAVLLNGWFGWPFLAAARWCRRHRVPYLVWADMQERAPAPWYRTAVKRVSLRPFLRRAGAVAGWTPAARDYLVRWGGDPARAGVIPAAPPVEWMRERTRAWPAPERAAFRAARGGDEAPVLLYVGRFSEEKGVLDLLEAVARLGEAGSAPTLWLVGDGPLREAVDRRLGRGDLPAVRRLGAVPPEETWRYFAAADLLVLPSRWEMYSLALLEGMAAGLPVVATTAVGAAAQVLAVPEGGRLVPAADPAALAAVLGEVLADGADRRGMGAANQERVLQWGYARGAAVLGDLLARFSHQVSSRGGRDG